MTQVREIPVVGLLVDGAAFVPDAGVSVRSVEIQRVLNTAAVCEVGLYCDRFVPPMRMGQEIAVRLGGALTPEFTGQVTACDFELIGDSSRIMRIRAHDPLDRMRRDEVPRSYTDKTTLEIISDLAQRHGLVVQVDASALQVDARWPNFLKHAQSDLEAVRILSTRTGICFEWRDGTMRLRAMAEQGPPTEVFLKPPLRRFTTTTNTLLSRDATSVSGWDVTTGDLYAHRAQSRLGGPFDTAPERRNAQVSAHATDRSAIKPIAQGTQQQQDQAAHSIRVVFDDLVDLELGQALVLRDGDLRLNAPQPVTSRHILIDGAHGVEVTVATAPLPAPGGAAEHAILPATVVSVSDPEKLGRVRVSLDTAEDVETGWLRVVLPGAGKDKGLVALPDRGDRVVVLVAGPTPDHGLVLGGVVGPSRRDMGVSGSHVRQMLWTTSGGQSVTLDDRDGSLHLRVAEGAGISLGPKETRIEDGRGSYVAMRGSETVVHSDTDLTLEAPGRKMVIAAKSVDFQKR